MIELIGAAVILGCPLTDWAGCGLKENQSNFIWVSVLKVYIYSKCNIKTCALKVSCDAFLMINKKGHPFDNSI